MQPPEGAAVGDRVAAEGFSGEPDEVLNPKKKVRTSPATMPNMSFACAIWPTAWSWYQLQQPCADVLIGVRDGASGPEHEP